MDFRIRKRGRWSLNACDYTYSSVRSIAVVFASVRSIAVVFVTLDWQHVVTRISQPFTNGEVHPCNSLCRGDFGAEPHGKHGVIVAVWQMPKCPDLAIKNQVEPY